MNKEVSQDFDEAKSREIDRRAFLKGIGFVGAGAAVSATGLGLTACEPKDASSGSGDAQTTGDASTAATGTSVGDAQAKGELTWLPEEPADPTNIEEELSADIVIIGAGTAGVCAARSATDEGATVIAVEKAAEPAVCRSGQWAVIGGETMKTWGRGDGYIDGQRIVDYEMNEMMYYPKRTILSKWAKGCGEVFDWYIAAKEDLYICKNSADPIPDVECSLWPRHYPLPEGYNPDEERFQDFQTSVSFNPDQSPVLKANWAKAEAAGAVCYSGHFAEKLIKDGDRVVGVFARNAESGKYKKIIASKGVILASGEYASNPELLAYYVPDIVKNEVPSMWMNMDVEGNFTNTGDGLKLGAWVNAAIQQKHAPMVHYMGDMTTVGGSPFLRINLLGKRFMDEDVPALQVQNATENQPDKKFWTIWDANWTEQLQHFQPRFASVNYVVDTPTPEGLKINDVHPYVLRDACETAAAAEGATLLRGETIDELLGKMSDLQDIEAAKASIERYSELAKKGVDEDFHKPAKRMFPIETGPFYAFESGMNFLLACCGGLVSDEDCHTYDNEGKVIPGLYVAGNIQGDRYAVNYPVALSGLSHSLCMYYGYVAAKNIINGV
jgi:hypothetical protein